MRSLLMLRFTRRNVEPVGHYCSGVIRRLRSSPVSTTSHASRSQPGGMPEPTVTVYLKPLVTAKLVRREINADDLRRHRLNLTPAGRRVMVRGLSSRRPMPIIEFLAMNATGTRAS
jgi:hypothetical protein